MRHLRYWLLMFGVPLLAGCEDPLNIANPNTPDRNRALSTPSDLVQFIVNTWPTYHDAILGGTNDQMRPQLLVAGMENFSELANFGMNIRGSIPRTVIDNGRGNPVQDGNYRDFLRLSRAARSASLALAQLEKLGLKVTDSLSYYRASAFARFVLGVSLGTLAIAYDSAAIVAPDDSSLYVAQYVPPLSHYSAVSAAGFASLDEAVAIAQAHSAAFPLPATWLNSGSSTSQADFIRVVRSYRARLRAGVARTTTERAAVDWTAVIADAENGITADFQLQENPTAGWSLIWFVQHFVSGGWHRMHQYMIGFADTSGAFDAWLATPRASKAMFLIVTPDKRFPRGATRTAQQTSPSSTSPVPAGQYFRNRSPGEDIAGDGLGSSMYDHYRFRAFYNAGRIGAFPVLTRAEIDLLAAEGYIRQSNWAQAMAKINTTRTAAGLPALVGITSLNDSVPGGNGCVPRVPQPPNFTSTACGNIWEAMKWEKRMETAYTGYGNWFFDSRGWGDLPEGTALHWPVPNTEMDTRFEAFYSMGGCQNLSASPPQSAAKGTYGLSCLM